MNTAHKIAHNIRAEELFIRSMINNMNKQQKTTFTKSIYKNILRDINKLKLSDQVYIRDRVRQHFDQGKNVNNDQHSQIQNMERAVFFYRTKLGGLL